MATSEWLEDATREEGQRSHGMDLFSVFEKREAMKILFIDGHNFMYRARSGFQLGNWNVCYNFFRSLKPLVDRFAPNRVYFTLEGHPKRRYDLLPTYKANRHMVIDPSATPEELAEAQKKRKSEEDYRRQQGLIVDMLATVFPVSVMRHPDFEADDLIFNVVKNASSAVNFTVVSTDTDFIQMLQQFKNVELYNPVTKALVEAPDYDYATWKALRGDGSDNIKGLPGIGDKTAEQLLEEPEKLQKLFEDKDHAEQFSRNLLLIKFPLWNPEETVQMQSTEPTKDWDAVARQFEEWQFRSMLKEPYWSSFRATFDTLWP